MKIITINLPELYLAGIQILTDLKIYPSRSEALRIAIEDFLSKELEMRKDLDLNILKSLKKQGRRVHH